MSFTLSTPNGQNIYLKFDLEHKSLQSTLRRYIDYVGMVDEYSGYNYLLDDYNNNDLLNKLYNQHPKLELAKKLKTCIIMACFGYDWHLW